MEENSLDKQYKLIGHLLKGLEKMHLGYLLAENEEVDDSKLKNQPSNRIFNDVCYISISIASKIVT